MNERSEAPRPLDGVGHDLRGPLATILGNAEVLRDGYHGGLTERQQRCVAAIERAGRTLLERLGDVLDFAAGERGALELDRAPVALGALLRGLEARCAEAALRAGVALEVAPFERPAVVLIDARRVERALAIVVERVLQAAASAGRVRVAASIAPAADVARIHVEALAAGDGPPSAAGPPSTAVWRGGARRGAEALGVALMDQILALHGGRVRVAREPGVHRVDVELPCAAQGGGPDGAVAGAQGGVG